MFPVNSVTYLPGCSSGDLTRACTRRRSAPLRFAARVKRTVEQTGSVLHGTRTPRPDAGRVPITHRILNNWSVQRPVLLVPRLRYFMPCALSMGGGVVPLGAPQS